MKRTELSKVMRRAWAIARTTGKTFAVCLAKSWQLYRLAKQMRAGVVRFAYEKKDRPLAARFWEYERDFHFSFLDKADTSANLSEAYNAWKTAFLGGLFTW